MAVTFEISSGDAVLSNSTGRPNMLGNYVDDTPDLGKARQKCVQDLRRCLSTSRLQDGSGAGINELIGTLNRGGFGSITILIKSRIRSMFDAIKTLQRKRSSIRPPAEQFKNITNIIVTMMSDNTSFKFRVDTTTSRGATISQSGTIVPS